MSEVTDAARPPAGRPSVLLLGAGAHGPELTAALERLGARVTGADDSAAAADHDVVLDLRTACGPGDPAADPVPGVRAATVTADAEAMRRLAADTLGLPTVPFWVATSAAELAAVAAHAGLPLVITPLGPAAGERSVLLRGEDVAAAWPGGGPGQGGEPGQGVRVLAESVVEIDHEVTLLTVRGDDPAVPGVRFCEPIGHRGRDDATESWQPQDMSSAALDAARSIAARIVTALGGRGVFGVELLVRGDEVYFSRVDVRPFDAALVTVRTQRLSVFDLCARAALRLPVDTLLVSPGAAEVLDARAPSAARLADALQTAESDVAMLAERVVALATAPDVIRARDRVRQVAAALRGPGRD